MAGWEIFTGRVSSAVRGVPFFPGVGSPIVASCLAFPLSAPPFAVSSLDVIAASPIQPCRCPWNASVWTEPGIRPASIVCPCAQFRKDCWLPQKPNSSRWLRRGQRFFRNWTPEDSLVAGAHNGAGLPEISGKVSRVFLTLNAKTEGAFNLDDKSVGAQSGGESSINGLIFSASKSNTIYGNSPTVMPDSANQPLMIYLGRPA